jgi:YD repeat-containing protein
VLKRLVGPCLVVLLLSNTLMPTTAQIPPLPPVGPVPGCSGIDCLPPACADPCLPDPCILLGQDSAAPLECLGVGPSSGTQSHECGPTEYCDPCDPYGGNWPECDWSVNCDNPGAPCCEPPTAGDYPVCTGTSIIEQQVHTRHACARTMDPVPAAVKEPPLAVTGVLSWQEDAGGHAWTEGCDKVFYTSADVCQGWADQQTFKPQRGVLCGPWVEEGKAVACRLEGALARDPNVGLAFGWERDLPEDGLVSIAEGELVQVAVRAGPLVGVRATNPYSTYVNYEGLETARARVLVYPTQLDGQAIDPGAALLVACTLVEAATGEYVPEAPSGVTPAAGIQAKPVCACSGGNGGATVNLGNGEAVFRLNPFTLRSERGPSISLNMTYRSQDPASGGFAFGPGFSHAYERHLAIQPDGILHYNGDGLADFYNLTALGYTSPPGVFSSLEATSTGYDLVHPHGDRDHYDAQGFLVAYEDRNGNQLRFNRTGAMLHDIIDAHDRKVTLAYDANLRLASIVGVHGAQARFEYANGRLAKVLTTPTAPNTPGPGTTFTWNANGLLATVTDPEGHPYWSTTYTQGNQPGRWLATAQGQGAGSHQYTYDFDRLQTKVTDPLGNVVVYTFQDPAHLFPVAKWVKSNGADPDDHGGNWTYEYNADGLVVREQSPRGVITEYEHDSLNPQRRAQANLLSRTVHPLEPDKTPFDTEYEAYRARFGLPDQEQPIQTTYTYEPLFNQVQTVVEARGNDPTHTPPNKGAGGPSRYTTTYIFDYQEATLGDLNGDGITTQAHGNIIQVVRPTTHPNGAPNPFMTPQASAQAWIETYAYNDHGQVTSYTDAAGTRTNYTYYPSNGQPLDASDLEGYLQSTVQDIPPLDMPEEAEPLTDAVAEKLRTEYDYNPDGGLKSIVDPAGIQADLDVSPRCVIAGFTLNVPNPPKVGLEYDRNDRITKVKTQLAPGLHQVKTSTYDALGRVIQESIGTDVALPGDMTRTTSYVYDGAGNLLQRTNPDGGVETWTYNQRGQEVQHAFQGHPAEKRRYDADGNLVKVIDPTGATTRHQRDGFGRERAVTTPLNHSAYSYYDAADHVIATFRKGGSEARHAVATQTMTGNAFVDRFRDHPELQEVLEILYPPTTEQAVEDIVAVAPDEFKLFLFDERGRMYQEDVVVESSRGRPPDGPLTPGDFRVSTLTEHDVRDRILRSVNDNGHKTTYEYDALGRETNVTDELGNRVQKVYNEQGSVVEKRSVEIGPDGVREFVTRYDYDGAGRLLNETSPSGGVTRKSYDAGGMEPRRRGPHPQLHPLGLIDQRHHGLYPVRGQRQAQQADRRARP